VGEDNTRIPRRSFLKAAIAGAVGMVAATNVSRHDVPVANRPSSATPPPIPLPRSCLMLIGGGDQQCTIEELQERIHTMTPDECDSKNLFRKMIALSPRQPPVVEFITNASKVYPMETGKQYQMIFKRLGAKEANYIDSRDPQKMNDPAIVARLRKADIVFITGGDQTDLEKIFRNSKALACLHDRYIHDPNFVYGGSSAGAMIVSHDMIDGNPKIKYTTPPPMNKGFEFLPIIVETHMNGKEREWRILSAVAHLPDNIGIGLDNATAVIIKQGKAEVWGNGRVLVARNAGNDLPLDKAKKVPLSELPHCQRFEGKGIEAFCYRQGEHFNLGAFARVPDTLQAPVISQRVP
jgi:cyanophycinase